MSYCKVCVVYIGTTAAVVKLNYAEIQKLFCKIYTNTDKDLF